MLELKKRPITDTHPDKLKYWDYSSNEEYPADFNYQSTIEVYSKCTENEKHRWKQSIGDFLRRQKDCMYCTLKPINRKNRLSRYPKIASEFDVDENKHLRANTVKFVSSRPVFWKCNKNPEHRFCARIKNRIFDDTGCPHCESINTKYEDSLGALYPKLSDKWDFQKNENLLPEHVLPTSHYMVNWHCGSNKKEETGHKLVATIAEAVQDGLDCVICRREMNWYESLAVTATWLARQWHKTKNRDITPSMVSAGDSFLAWWQCKQAKDHQWRAAVGSRFSSRTGCPFCARMETSTTSSFALHNPDLLKEWSFELNQNVDPNHIPPSYEMPVWWNCTANEKHVWETPVRYRLYENSGCPYCANRKTGDVNSLASLFPEIAAEWHRTLNKKITPDKVVPGSTLNVYWQCSLFEEHVWRTKIYHRTKERSGCPKCLSFRCPKEESLAAKFPDTAAEWHPSLNHPISPELVKPFSQKKVWWQCGINSEHQWETQLSTRTFQGSCCPYCSGRIITSRNSLAAVCPQIAKEWHPTKNGILTPEKISFGSKKKAWWICSKGPDHEWEASVGNRVSLGAGCPSCANKKFSVTHSIQYKIPELAPYFHPRKNGKETASTVRAAAEGRFWWICIKNPDHEWQSTIKTEKNADRHCPYCS